MATEVGTADTDLLVFKGKNLQHYKVVELKRFLEERGLKKSGKKIELCERLRRYLVNEALDGPGGHRRPNSDSTSSAKGTHQGREEFYASFSARLPDFSQINRSSNRRIYSVEGKIFCDFIQQAYEEAAHWQKNVFKLPSGKAGKAFIKLLTEWLMRFNNKDEFMGIALTVYMTLPTILLQKPSSRSKAKENSMSLLRRIEWLQNGNFDRLLAECREIQRN